MPKPRRPLPAALTILSIMALLALVAMAPAITEGAGSTASARLDEIRLPAGFAISVYADHIPGARSLALAPDGTVFVGTRREGKVYALVDKNRDGAAEEIVTIARDLNQPNGVAFRDGSLYVAEIDRVSRLDDILANLRNPPKPVVVNDSLPKDEHHGWKYLALGPDGKLYLPVGFPCNVCEPGKPIYGTIARMNRDGSGLEVFASGIRNTVGFDFHPETRELWFTNNGRDWLGDDRPPDTLNKAEKPGLHFGFPYCNGDGPDPDFGGATDCGAFAKPALDLPAHVASLGMKFYTGAMFPAEYRGQIFIAEHGSWNRSAPVGYRITLVRLKDGKPVAYEPFAQGWLQGAAAWGRPVDVLVMDDGALLVSDDKAGAVYRITYVGK